MTPSMFAPVLVWLVVSAEPPAVVIERDAQDTVDLSRLGESATVDQRLQPSAQMEQGEVLAKLRVQAAVRSARSLLAERKFVDAIAHLEPCLDQASECPEVLETLETAYRGRISELLSHGLSRDAAVVAQRLRILSGSAVSAPAQPVTVDLPSPAPQAAPQRGLLPAGMAALNPAPAMGKIGRQMVDSVKSIIPRALRSDEEAPAADPLAEASVSLTSGTESTLDQAKRLFDAERYGEALVVYERAHQEDPAGTEKHRVRWGYCLLCVSIDRYNELLDQDPLQVDPAVWEDLRENVKSARQLAPTIPYCDKVVAAIDQRIVESHRRSAGAIVQASATSESTQAYGLSKQNSAVVPFRHVQGSSPYWQVTETANFVIHHRDRALAEEIASMAERARTFSQDSWFRGEPTPNWEPKCQLYLHPTAAEYGSATGVSPESPGHSKVVNNAGQIQSREVHVRCDDAAMKSAVLVHEVTHVVLAGRFGQHTLPRWADEGMAVLTEPIDKQNAHLGNLVRTQAAGRGYTCGQVMTMGQYPPGERMRDFYAHSVGVCRYLVERGGHERLVAFLRQSLDQGNYEEALRSVYGMSGFADLEADFRQFVASVGSGGAPVARR